MMTRWILLLLAPIILLASSSDAFVGSRRRPYCCTQHHDVSDKSKCCRLTRTTTAGVGLYPRLNPAASNIKADGSSVSSTTTTTTTLGMTSASSSIATVTRSTLTAVFSQLRHHAKILLLILLTASLVLAKRSNPQTLLWPGTQTDKDCDAPMPNGGYGCPFIGINFMSGSKEKGPMYKLFQLGQKYGQIYRLFAFGIPLVSISGKENVKAFLKNEFKGEGKGINNVLFGGEHNMSELFGDKSLLYENDSSKHGRLRRMVGEGVMTPVAISEALPSIQELASKQIDIVLKEETVQMESVFHQFTLDFAWKQILGLELTEEDIPEFRKQMEQWIVGLVDPLYLVPFRIPGLMTMTKAGRAKSYIVSKIEQKLQTLDRDGPDSSTLSKLYFATDEDGDKLTREEVIQNAMLLIAAGSETSSTTLTNAALLLGLHPNVWRKVQSEQEKIIAEFGEDVTRESLDKSIYLDSVIKETLRISVPFSLGEIRRVEDTVVVDGKQIPKNWFGFFNVKQTHWDDPRTFKEDGSHMDYKKGFEPERWLDDSTKPSEFMPFGEGAHRCVGERLGYAEMKTFLSILARRLEKVDLVNDDIVWKSNLLLPSPVDGAEIRIFPADTTPAVEYMI
eukprot:scaffold2187_cov127-Skeletonema_menzelii.AAC.2